MLIAPFITVVVALLVAATLPLVTNGLVSLAFVMITEKDKCKENKERGYWLRLIQISNQQ